MSKKLSLVFLVVAFGILMNCKSNNENVKIYKGELVIGHEVSSLKIENSNTEVWIDDSQEVLKKEYEKLTKSEKPYTPVLVELKGEMLPKATDGFAEEYDNVLKVVLLLKMTKK